MVETHVEPDEIPLVRKAHVGDELLLLPPLLACTHHDGRAVRVVRAHVENLVTAEPVEAHPDVRLDVLEHVPEVDGTVRVGQRARHEEATTHGARRRTPSTASS